MRYKYTAVVSVFILIISVLFISCSAGKENGTIDLSDIDSMNIGAEMPEIIFYDEEEIILSGSFGILGFNITEEEVTRRINFDAFPEIMDYRHFYSFSDDGKRMFITLPETEEYFEYNLKTGKLKSVDKIEETLFSPSLLSMEHSIQIAENAGSKSLIGNTCLMKDSSVTVLRAESNWQMKTLEIVEYDLKNDKEIKVIDVFK